EARIRTKGSRLRRRIAAPPATDAELFREGPAQSAQARHRSRRVRVLRRRYGITIVGAVIPSQTTQAQPSAGETGKLIELVRREHVKAVFPEKSVNARLAETVARETSASAHYSLYGDTLGPKASTGATYLQMEAANANELVRGFTGGARGCRTAAP